MNGAKEKLLVMDKKKKTNNRKPKPKRKAGAAKMREAADKIVGRDSKPILEALSKGGQNGRILSAKFLYDLAHSAEEAGEAQNARTFRSMALELANAPEWTEPSEAGADEDAERIAG